MAHYAKNGIVSYVCQKEEFWLACLTHETAFYAKQTKN